MADLIINGTTYGGSPTNTALPQRPDQGVERTVKKVGRMLEAADGSTTFLLRAFKSQWKIAWTKSNGVTRAAVIAVHLLATTFSFTDVNGTVYTVLNAGEDDYTETISSDKANALMYDLVLILREA